MRSAALIALAVLVLLLAPLRASAETEAALPILALDWSAPAGCPDGGQVTARVEQLVGRSRGATTLAARARMTESDSPPGYRLVLRVGGDRSGSTERTMTDLDCARLAEAAAVVLALDIEDEALTQESAPPSPDRAARAPGGGATPRPPRSRRADIPRSAPQSSAMDVALRARLTLDHGSLPRTTLGLGAGAELGRGHLSLDLGASVYQRQFVGGPRGGSAGAYVDLALVGTHGCVRKTLASIGVRACMGLEIGRESTVGLGIQVPRTSAGLWAAGSVLLEARPWSRHMLSPAAGVSLGHPFVAPDVVVDGFGVLFAPPVAFFRAHVGLDFRHF